MMNSNKRQRIIGAMTALDECKEKLDSNEYNVIAGGLVASMKTVSEMYVLEIIHYKPVWDTDDCSISMQVLPQKHLMVLLANEVTSLQAAIRHGYISFVWWRAFAARHRSSTTLPDTGATLLNTEDGEVRVQGMINVKSIAKL
jgi:hypothetical protein